MFKLKSQKSSIPKSIFSKHKKNKIDNPLLNTLITQFKTKIKDHNPPVDLNITLDKLIQAFDERSDDEIALLRKLSREIKNNSEKRIRAIILSKAINEGIDIDIEFNSGIPFTSDYNYNMLYNLYSEECEYSLDDDLRFYLEDKNSEYHQLNYVKEIEIYASDILNKIERLLTNDRWDKDFYRELLLDLLSKNNYQTKLEAKEERLKMQTEIGETKEENLKMQIEIRKVEKEITRLQSDIRKEKKENAKKGGISKNKINRLDKQFIQIFYKKYKRNNNNVTKSHFYNIFHNKKQVRNQDGIENRSKKIEDILQKNIIEEIPEEYEEICQEICKCYKKITIQKWLKGL